MKRYPLGMPAWVYWVIVTLAAILIGSIPAVGPWLVIAGLIAAFVYFYASVKPEPKRSGEERRSRSEQVPHNGNQVIPPRPPAPTQSAPAPSAREIVTPEREEASAVTPAAPTARRATRAGRGQVSTSATKYALVGWDSWPSVEVAGEFARIDALWRAIGQRPRIDEEIVIDAIAAELLPEPTNPHDSNAVMVIINGQHVGYLEREQAAEYHAPLADLVAAGVSPSTRARIWTTQRRDWDGSKAKGRARITLALNAPGMLAPTNNPPEAPYSLLPWARAVQVSGEENHLDVIGEHLQNGESLAIGTIVEERTSPARAEPKAYIEVRIDGERVGQMTPSMSENFLPAVRHLAEQGQVAAVWLKIKGSMIAAQITVQAQKAHELPDNWFERPATIPPLRPRPARSENTPDAAADVGEIRAHARNEPMWDE
ncbi:HIRAN domain-containing protein [Microbacterium excoecariae]|uniref:HIRAN domain-containing protein n=1 Tax=Microbacterium excoecariae TaxID=2715210 RepID=UPI001408E564|nr:HIRAN domain-containing protein [Microbacterium excoecariae]NHI16890.1 hypothetical protein [Microbacterium excoecariae]